MKKALVIFLIAQSVLVAITLYLYVSRRPVETAPPPASPPPLSPSGDNVLEVAWQDIVVELSLLESDPAVAVTPAQAGRILPHFRTLRACKDRLFQAEVEAVQYLVAAQRDFICAHRWDLLMKHPLPGEFLRRQASSDVSLPVSAAVWVLQRKARGAQGAAPASGRGGDHISWLHLSQGILVLETRGALALTPGQAKAMAPHMQQIERQIQGLCAAKGAILAILSERQLGWMKEEKRRRTGMAPHFPMMKMEPDYGEVEKMLLKKIPAKTTDRGNLDNLSTVWRSCIR